MGGGIAGVRRQHYDLSVRLPDHPIVIEDLRRLTTRVLGTGFGNTDTLAAVVHVKGHAVVSAQRRQWRHPAVAPAKSLAEVRTALETPLFGIRVGWRCLGAS